MKTRCILPYLLITLATWQCAVAAERTEAAPVKVDVAAADYEAWLTSVRAAFKGRAEAVIAYQRGVRFLADHPDSPHWTKVVQNLIRYARFLPLESI